MGCLYCKISSIAIRGHAVFTQASTRYPWSSSGATRSMRNRFACFPCFSARAFSSVANSIRTCPSFFETMIPKTVASWARAIAACRCRSTWSRTSLRSRGVDELHRGERRPREVIKENPVVSEVRHRSVAQVDDEVDRHLGDVACPERGVRGNEARDPRLGLDFLSELHGLGPKPDGKLQA